jgi:hypothetical protein
MNREDYDDTKCVKCGAALPAYVQPFTWQDNGFCGLGCALACDQAFIVTGRRPALELARSRYPGPGFEETLVRDWPRAELSVWKLRSEDDHVATRGSWAWRVKVHGEGESLAFRLTARAYEAIV